MSLRFNFNQYEHKLTNQYEKLFHILHYLFLIKLVVHSHNNFIDFLYIFWTP